MIHYVTNYVTNCVTNCVTNYVITRFVNFWKNIIGSAGWCFDW